MTIICDTCGRTAEAVWWLDDGQPEGRTTLYPCGHHGSFTVTPETATYLRAAPSERGGAGS